MAKSKKKGEVAAPSAQDEGFVVDQPRIARAVREILCAIGENPDREGLLETPQRVARMYAELFQGLNQDPAVHLKKFFTEKYGAYFAAPEYSADNAAGTALITYDRYING